MLVSGTTDYYCRDTSINVCFFFPSKLSHVCEGRKKREMRAKGSTEKQVHGCVHPHRITELRYALEITLYQQSHVHYSQRD
jgi:hypothetical protein